MGHRSRESKGWKFTVIFKGKIFYSPPELPTNFKTKDLDILPKNCAKFVGDKVKAPFQQLKKVLLVNIVLNV